MKKTEYEYIVRVITGTPQEIEEQIEILGSYGWRLVSVSGNKHYFERMKT